MNLKGETELSIFTVPMGNYVELTGLKVCVSSWRRTPDNAIPARAKCTGSYVNTALAVDEAHRAGYDDAIFLTQDGQVSEASAANIFLVRKGELITPPVTADILEGITRDAVMELAGKELGMPVIERDGGPHGALRRRRGVPLGDGVPDRTRRRGGRQARRYRRA